ncbi:Integral membrane Yip1 family protein [Striga hermonthica]|uniref:Integral membrane Yip1 family protein n=1 Tax=Striga hermonthica TaxID=68872 RepID=A0A9N7RFH0_STRHE|nr:Integral membrane Yip1 family protein [Striga hermonthica]
MMSGNYSSLDNQNDSGYVPTVADRPSHVAVKFTDYSLQTFAPAGAHGKISDASGPPRDADDTFLANLYLVLMSPSRMDQRFTLSFQRKLLREDCKQPRFCLSVIPQEIFRWVIAGVAGFMFASFVALNLRNHIKSAGESWFLIVAAIFFLQLALALALKFYLFTVPV